MKLRPPGTRHRHLITVTFIAQLRSTHQLTLLLSQRCAYSLRVYLNILPEVSMNAKDTVTQFKQTMDVLISKYATRLLKLNVDEIEVKVSEAIAVIYS